MISLYRPGTGILHRMPAGAKLLLLALSALGLSLLPLDVNGTIGALVVVSALYPVAGLSWRALGEAWWRLRWLMLVLGGALWLLVSPTEAVVNTGRVVALLLLAELVTRTTRTGELLEVLRRILAPLRRVGVDPDSIALALSLTITMIPVISGFAAQVRDAQRARGVRLGPRAALPLMVLTMRHADDVGDALVARGIGR
ncbi:energy-coupling factor transporter transmembrane component T [Microbacterium sp.]|uniref:energy-coupling factor transporter transmembrane component T n=1 Tax=Microbacterium sp. TaxID=51671 RepID=UPI002811F85F|nr:energy-coupling factor transporter transmembrane component T [Microbacterium sp.]